MRIVWLGVLWLSATACDDTLFGAPSEDPVVQSESVSDSESVLDSESQVASDTDGDGYHPAGWSSPDVHGLAAKLQEQQCTSCHGEDLTGLSDALSCDSCHPSGWRTDCTFCHGGELTDDGAPPLDIDGTESVDDISFPPHPDHVTAHIGPGFDCAQCHDKPTDVLSDGHLFVGDTTAGQAEVDFSSGLSDAALWSAPGCTNLYCHGDGQRDNGTVEVGDGPMTCSSCHASYASGDDSWDRMSGEHDKHLGDVGLSCEDCHGETTADATSILDTEVHVDGEVQVEPPSAVTWNGSSCTGTCHGETHNNRRWDR